MKKVNKLIIIFCVIFLIVFIAFFITIENSSADAIEPIYEIKDVYELSVEEFQDFLKNQSLDKFKNKKTDKSVYTHPSGTEYFLMGATQIFLYDPIREILKDNVAVEGLLEKNGIFEEIEEINIVCSRDIPITVQVKNKSKKFYITWEKHETEMFKVEYCCNFYTADAYIDKFLVKKGELVINNVTIVEEIEMYNEYALVPFIEVITSLGADVECIGGDNVKIYIADECYDLNLKEVSLTNKNKYDGYNIFNLIAGEEYTISYDLENGLLIDTNVLSSVLYEMGIRCQIEYDMNLQKVNIQSV